MYILTAVLKILKIFGITRLFNVKRIKNYKLNNGVGLSDHIMPYLKRVRHFLEHHVALSHKISNMMFFVPFLEDGTVTGYTKNIQNIVYGNILIPSRYLYTIKYN